ncbi:MAG: alpha/beta fold hydrolase [Chromatiales bacterium]|jgi:pimeloyl-ACP methyl ester carboxylesterase
MKSFGWTLLTAAVLYLLVCLLLYANQRNQMYFPTAEVNHDNANSFRLSVEQASLKVWSLASDNADAIIYFGGNAENVAGNIRAFSSLFPERAAYLPNYRGYGGSSGEPTEEALYQDALALYDHISARHKNVAVIGRSLGSGIASYLAAQRPVSKLVLVTPFSSMTAVAGFHYPYLPVSLLLQDRYDSLSRARRIQAPVLIVLAAQDRIIPREITQALIDAFPKTQRHVVELSDAGHNFSVMQADYLAAITGFLGKQD